MSTEPGHGSLALNIEAPLLRRLGQLVAAQNLAQEREPGRPRHEFARTREQWQEAAAVMAQAFVHSTDRSWLAWLQPASVQRALQGDGEEAERRLARIILYLFDEAHVAGGLVSLETAEVGRGGQRVVRGAALRRLPAAVPAARGLVHKYVVGGIAALRSDGLLRALAANRAYADLSSATEAVRQRAGVPRRCIHGLMACVSPQWQQQHVFSRLSAPVRRLADEFQLHMLMQSSDPQRNDARVFQRHGFEKIGEHLYGVSRWNNLEPTSVNLMLRRPLPRIRQVLGEAPEAMHT